MSQIATVASHKKVFVQTFGCQMNERDSESVRGLMQSRGYDFTEDIDQADVVLYNTCSVRQHAEDRVFGRHGKLMSIKKQRPDTVIGIMGCMAQEHGADFFR
ncbi:MAG: tRNA (N6-isopentenyl adenosine(37)-C2)-methylthiotransferase MiaB, partial [Candidatus Omnitrophica bacterium]|nr:tRNA (N6-isopentenyl adenosine(37)-C2)-methylthiotransferase MiaB [Candidatus Omnitrophota bacterium]